MSSHFVDLLEQKSPNRPTDGRVERRVQSHLRGRFELHAQTASSTRTL